MSEENNRKKLEVRILMTFLATAIYGGIVVFVVPNSEMSELDKLLTSFVAIALCSVSVAFYLSDSY